MCGIFEVEHGAGPDAGVSCVGDEYGIGRKKVRQFFAEAFGTHGFDVGVDVFGHVFFPCVDEFVDAGDPLGARLCVAGLINHEAQCISHVALKAEGEGIVATQFFGIDVELNDGRALWRHLIPIGNLPARMTADEENQIGFKTWPDWHRRVSMNRVCR